jgi:glycine/D-amino acid oxidase-like deaminating enzyme/nitrite reductase/ring-hydroxylating ferredoxin subunit
MQHDLYDILKKAPQSYWLTPPDQPGYEELKGDLNAEVAIVGGGIAGITLAYLLCMEGLRPVVLEANRILFGTTGHTTAKITSQHDLIYDRITTQFGKDLARQYATANESAIREIEKTVRELDIQCDFEPQSAFVYAREEGNIPKIYDEVRAASEVGIEAEYIESIPFDIPIQAGIRFANQAQFHPRKYLMRLAKYIHEKGCNIYERSPVVDLEENDGVYTLKTAAGCKVRATTVVIASHYPFFNKAGMYFARLYVERSYLLAIRAREEYPGGMYISLEEPIRSLRSQRSDRGELTLVGGGTHKSGQAEDTREYYRALIDFAAKHFTVESIPFHWSAQDCMTLDGIPYAGHFTDDTPGLYVATGFGKWGMTNATASAMLIRDLIVHGRCEWEDIYSPSRFDLAASVKNMVVENANVAVNLVKDKLTSLPEDIDLTPGEGKVIERDGRRVGVYKDDEGHLHIVDTTCTHMGCELNWNSAEKSWDCPCHGSRFTYDGEIIEGPAVRPLNSGKSVNTLEKVIKDEF